MDSIRAEVEDLRRRRKDDGSGVVDVASLVSHVSVIIKKTKHKAVSATFHFCEMYPTKAAMVELNSKFLSSRCLDAMTELCEEECGKLVGKPHITSVVALLEKYLDTNPLCVCADELFEIKKKLGGNGSWACRPNSSKGTLTVRKGKYSASFSLAVPEEYPARCVEVDDEGSDLPNKLRRWLVAQAREVSRKCVEPPLRPKPKDPPFRMKRSLAPVAYFLIDAVQRYADEKCQKCGKPGLPEDPEKVVNNEAGGMHVERMLCGHVYHLKCMVQYLKTPPFAGQKKCHACGAEIHHDKYKLNPRLAEARWAHQQARERELKEVMDFLE